jgi:hypothetical protein
MTDQFDEDITRLGMLAGKVETMDAFAALYKRIMEDVYTDMMQPRNNRALWLAALRQLNFDVIPLNPRSGRPPGR